MFLMNDFHYKYIRKAYGNEAKLLLADTERSSYVTEINYLYGKLYKYKHKFNLKNYAENSESHDRNKKMIIGTRKSETKCFPLVEFVELSYT